MQAKQSNTLPPVSQNAIIPKIPVGNIDFNNLINVPKRKPNSFSKETLTAIPYTTEKVIAGMAGGIESLADFTTNVILGGGSWITSLGGTAKNPVSEFLDKQNKILQVTNPSEMYSQNIEKRYNMSNSTKRVGNVFEGAGNLIPTIATEYLTGSAAPAGEMYVAKYLTTGGKITSKMSQAAQTALTGQNKVSKIVFGAQAAGGYTKDSYKEQIERYNSAKAMGKGEYAKEPSMVTATQYGIMGGAAELASEALFGGLAGLGKQPGIVSNIAKWIGGRKVTQEIGEKISKNVMAKFVLRVAKNPIAKKAFDLMGEGVEELIVSAVDPLMKRITYDVNAPSVTAKQLGESFVSGIALSFLMQASNSATNKAMAKTNAKKLNIAAENLPAELRPTPLDEKKSQLSKFKKGRQNLTQYIKMSTLKE